MVPTLDESNPQQSQPGYVIHTHSHSLPQHLCARISPAARINIADRQHDTSPPAHQSQPARHQPCQQKQRRASSLDS
ncbi:hypothetical protein ACN47E_004678 [Coniothyrium glycines]